MPSTPRSRLRTLSVAGTTGVLAAIGGVSHQASAAPAAVAADARRVDLPRIASAIQPPAGSRPVGAYIVTEGRQTYTCAGGVFTGGSVPEAQLILHGITDDELAGAPGLAEVLPALLQLTAGRTVLAYNAEFDHSVISRHAGRDGLDPAHLGDIGTWACLMGRRSDWQLVRRWLPLRGGHRARGAPLR